MTEVIFSHYQLSWKVDGEDQAADFWLPGNSEITDTYVGDMLNSVELSSDDLHWSIEKIETRVYRMVG